MEYVEGRVGMLNFRSKRRTRQALFSEMVQTLAALHKVNPST